MRRDGQRGRGQRKGADKEEEEEQWWRVTANSARSHLSSSSIPLFFVNRWVEVSDCDESQNGKKDRHIHTAHTHRQSHMATHTHRLSSPNRYSILHPLLFSPTIIFSYDMITLYLCVFFIVVMDHSGQTGSTISLLQWRHCTHTVQKVSIETQWWQCFFFLDRETDTVREGGEGEAPGRLWIRWMVERKR